MKQNPLLGVFEIALFMKTGINHFDDDFRKMLFSFIFIAINFVFVLFSIPYLQQSSESIVNASSLSAIGIYGVKFILVTAIGLVFTYYLCKIMKRKHTFIKLVTTSNWTSLISLVLFIPFFGLMASGMQTYDNIFPYLIVLSLYGYGITGFIIRYIVDIPCELAAFMTICLLAINELGFDLIEKLFG